MSPSGEGHSPSAPDARRSHLLAGLYIVIGSLALFQIIGAATYFVETRWPLALSTHDFLKWILPGGLLVGALCGLGMIWRIRRQRRRGRVSGTPRRFLAVSAAVLLGLGAGGILVILANALLDASPAQYHDVEVMEMRSNVSHGLLHSRNVTYAELGSRRGGRHLVSELQGRQFKMGGAGVLDIRPGFLGMPWLRQICPVDLREVPSPEGYPEVIAVPRRDAKPDAAEFMYFTLVVLLGDGQTMPASEALWELVRQHDVSLGGTPPDPPEDSQENAGEEMLPATQSAPADNAADSRL
jgi:hypothetical protein